MLREAAGGGRRCGCRTWTGGPTMIKVKTFGSQFKIFHITQELEGLDREVTEFLAAEKAKGVVGVSDATTSDTSGATMGIIRVVTYEV
jgi:hypothetical protein